MSHPRALTISAVLLLLINSYSFAQESDPFAYASRIQPSADAWQMARHGEISPDLHTGAMAWSLPLYTYRDEDFTIPISLDYHFDGCRPSQPAGVVGMGWNLNCGGVITRQVVGLPDDYTKKVTNIADDGEPHESWQVGFYFAAIDHSHVSPMSLGDSLVDGIFLIESHCVGQISPVLVDGGNNALTMLMGSSPMISESPVHYFRGLIEGGPYFDPNSDIYHFSIPNLSGDFIILPSGEIKVYNCSVPEGEVQVEIAFFTLANGGCFSRITLIHKGYRYLFGGDLSHIEYSFDALVEEYTDSTDPTRYCFSALRLKQITAPNGRTVLFNHSAVAPCSSMTWKGGVSYRMAGIAGQPQSTSAVVSNLIYKPVQSIIVDSDTLIHMQYADKEYAEFGYNAFTGMTHNQYRNILPWAQGIPAPDTLLAYNIANRLASVVIRNRTGEQIDSIALSQTYTTATAGHSPKMFLNTVTSNAGRYSFSYMFPGGSNAFPLVNSVETDHWGYWNGYNSYFLPTSANKQIHSLYDLPHSGKDPDTLKTRHGALCRIDYPSGGWSQITYENNTASRCIELDVDNPNSTGYDLIDTVLTKAGGVRVKSITNHTGPFGSFEGTIEYDYCNSGVLMQMPRYFIDAYAYYYRTEWEHHNNGGLGHWIAHYSSGYFGLTTCDSGGLPMASSDGHVLYSQVRTRLPDDSFIEQRFPDPENYPDHYLRSNGSIASDIYKTMGGSLRGGEPFDTHVYYVICAPSLDSLSHNIASANILMADFASLRSKPTLELTYSSDSTLLHKAEYSWNAEIAASATGVYNVFCDFIADERSFIQPRLCSVINTEFLPGGGSLSDTTLYTYNNLGQQTVIEKRGFDGDIRRSRLRYEYESDTTATVPKANVSDVVTTRLVSNGNNSLEYVTSLNHFDYDTDSARRHLPIKAKNYGKPVPWIPSIVTNDTLWFSPIAPCDTLTRTISYDAKQRPSVLSLPGNAYLSFVWDTAGRYVLSREENGPAMKSYYTWKDLVGLTQLTDPTGHSEWYSYDEKNRLAEVRRADSVLVKQYDYHIYSEDTTLGPSSIKQTIWRTSTANNREIAYYDGLGYPIQMVRTSTQPTGGHIVTPIAYDALRRDDVRAYLPYQASQSAFDSTAFTKQKNHYRTRFSQDTIAYTEKEYGTSSAGRLLSVRQPVKAYADSSKKTVYDYRVNNVEDSILDLSVTVSTQPQLSVAAGYLPAGKLLLTKTTDEDGCTSEVFTNSAGKTVLSRQRTGGQRLDTYFVYDLRDSLVCVLQPEGAAAIAQNASYDILQPVTVHSMAVIPTTLNSLLEKYAFLYDYDSWGRLRLKKKPGAAPEEFVMDDRGRVALSRDGNLRDSSRWLFSEYDTYDALTRRHLLPRSVGQDTLWKALAGQVDSVQVMIRDTLRLWTYFRDANPLHYEPVCTKSQFVFEGDSLFNISGEFLDFAGRTGLDDIGFYVTMGNYHYYASSQSILLDPILEWQVSAVWPDIFAEALTGKTLLEEHTYNRGTNPAIPQNLAFEDVTGIVTQNDLRSSLNLEVWQRQLLLPPGRTVPGDTLRYVERAFWYDTLGRVVQTVETNALGGISRTSAKYDYLGNVLASEEKHTIAGSNTPVVKRASFTFDKQGRIASETVTINGSPLSTTWTSFEYDILGHQTNAYWSREDGYEMSENCFYDIRGRLTDKEVYRITPYEPTGGDNGGGGNSDGDDEEEEEEQESIETLVFGQYLKYFNPVKQSSQRRWNGLISEIAHQHGENAAMITNGYFYDNAGRLTDNIRYDGTQQTDKFAERYLSYDRNGNILTLKRYGAMVDAPQDNLAYTYNGNKLTQLNNSGTITGSYSYTYDNNGNTLTDSRRGLSFTWNHLNLPASITSTPTGSSSTVVDYTYLADGTKAITSSGNEGYAYLGTMTYKLSGGTWSLESVPFTCGRFIANASGGFDEYRYITDHLGSTRLIVKGYDYQPDERNDYYPFGMRIADNTLSTSAVNRWRFAGEEIQTLGNIELVDFGARLYDCFRGQWPTQDPLAEKYFDLSLYGYCAGNPICIIDPLGSRIEGVSSDDVKKFQEDIYLVLSDDKFSTIRSLIEVKGRSIKKVDPSKVQSVLSDMELTTDESAFVNLVFNVINSNSVYLVEYTAGDYTSQVGAEAFINHMSSVYGSDQANNMVTPNGMLHTGWIKQQGNGLNVPISNGSHSFISYTQHDAERARISGHEVFGHGVAAAKGLSPAANNNNAIQTENLILRLLNKSQTNGSNHGGYNQGHITHPYELPIVK